MEASSTQPPSEEAPLVIRPYNRVKPFKTSAQEHTWNHRYITKWYRKKEHHDTHKAVMCEYYYRKLYSRVLVDKWWDKISLDVFC